MCIRDRLMHYRLAPGSEDALLPWSVSWKGSGISYGSVELTRLEAAGGKLAVAFRLSASLSRTTGLPEGKSYAASFTPDEFLKLMDEGELEVKKASLYDADLGWPASLLARAGAFSDAVREKLKKK